jgi:4-amino-4-deoxychorismate lyase
VPECLNNLQLFENYLQDEVTQFQQSGSLLPDDPLRIRVDVSLDGSIKTTMATTPITSVEKLYPRELFQPSDVNVKEAYNIVLDRSATIVSEFSWVKTSKRQNYDQARSRMKEVLACMDILDLTTSEIILHNASDEVTEGTISNVYFWRNGKWISPPAGPTNGGLEGVARRWALESGICQGVEPVSRGSVQLGEMVWISNGVRGFNIGKIVWM